MNKIMISCDEATLISDKKQYKEASSWELIKMGFHVLMCKSCKVYTTQNNVLTKILTNERLPDIDNNESLLTEEAKKQIKDKIHKQG